MTQHRGRVLVVDDDRSIADALREMLARYLFYVRAVYSAQEAINEIAVDSFDVFVIDWIMPGSDGRAVIEYARRNSPEAAIIVHSGYETSDAQATVSGVQEFVEKGPSHEPIVHAVERGLAQARARRKDLFAGLGACHREARWFIDAIRDRISLPRFEEHGGIVASPGALPDVLRWWVACGEEKSGQPFHEVDCRSWSSDVFEETIIGRVTMEGDGMPVVRRGMAELAAGGALCVRNVHTLPQQHQRKLADVAQGRLRRVGSDRYIDANVRLLMTVETTGSPAKAMNAICPELRGLVKPKWTQMRDAEWTPEARVALTGRMLAGISKSQQYPGPSVAAILGKCAFSATLSDLKRAVERAHELGAIGHVDIEDFGMPVVEAQVVELRSGKKNLRAWRSAQVAFETYYLCRLLSQTGGNVSQAAKRAGVGRQSLYRAIKRCKIDLSAFESARQLTEPPQTNGAMPEALSAGSLHGE